MSRSGRAGSHGAIRMPGRKTEYPASVKEFGLVKGRASGAIDAGFFSLNEPFALLPAFRAPMLAPRARARYLFPDGLWIRRLFLWSLWWQTSSSPFCRNGPWAALLKLAVVFRIRPQRRFLATRTTCGKRSGARPKRIRNLNQGRDPLPSQAGGDRLLLVRVKR